MAASALASPGSVPLGLISPRSERTAPIPPLPVAVSSALVGRSIGAVWWVLVPAVLSTGLVDLRPDRLGGRPIRRLEP